jgi:ketosteroid isomerase-like protein
MRRIAICTFLAFLAFVTLRPAFAQTSKGEFTRAEAEKTAAAFASAFNRGDIVTTSAFYANDAIAFPPDSDMVKGRPAIEAFWKATKDAGGKSLELKVVDVQSSGNLGIETGTAVLHMKPANQPETAVNAKYVVVWQKQESGSWKIIRDIWNSMAPMAAAPAMAATPAMATTPAMAATPHH